MTSNPYEATKAVGPGVEPLTPDAHTPLPGCALFFLHMTVASVLAPAVGVAVFTLCTANWSNWSILDFPLAFVGSLVFGVLSFVFIWFITVPFGLITYGFCIVARNVGVTNRLIWALAGMFAGLAFSWIMGHSPDFARALVYVSGAAIGLVSGLVLWKVWHMDLQEGIAANPQGLPNNGCDGPGPADSGRG